MNNSFDPECGFMETIAKKSDIMLHQKRHKHYSCVNEVFLEWQGSHIGHCHDCRFQTVPIAYSRRRLSSDMDWSAVNRVITTRGIAGDTIQWLILTH